jgi:hypothetical protein
MPLQDIIITGSIGSIATQSYGQRTYISSTDDQSFPLETITGSQAGSWPNFVPGANYTVDLIVNVTQSWSGSNVTPVGIVPFVQDTNDEFFNGEFSGSNYVVTDGNLTDEDCQQFLEVNTTPTSYSVFPYIEAYLNGTPVLSSGSFSSFIHRYTSPNPGQLLFSVREDTNSGTKYTKIEFVKIARIDQEGNDNTLSLQELTSLRWTDSTAGEIILNVISISEYLDYYLYEVTSKTWVNLIYFADDNVLDYTFTASSAITSIPINQYLYLTSSWTVNTDTAGGFSNGQYTFPLTPNCGITYTASIGLTLTTSASFSLAINGYDPLYPIYVPNAATSVPSPISTTGSGTNVYYLSPGTYNITISSSDNYPIQNYKYEIDAYLYNDNILFNSDLVGIGSGPNGLGPDGWMSRDNFAPTFNENEAFWSLETIDPSFSTNPIFSGYPGGVYYVNPNTVDPGDIFCTTQSLTPVFLPNETYTVEIVVPPLTYLGSIDPLLSYYLGPSAYPITCSYNRAQLSTPANHIGYIPSGAHGTFSFTFTAPNTGTPTTIGREIAILVPTASNYTINGENAYFTILKISAYIGSSATVNNLSFEITQSQLPQTSTSSVILEPYLTSTFRNSDCDVLMNNASQNDISGTRRRVLYDDGYIIPSNFQQIISGTAEYAEVNDYLYNANANVRPRYEGVRVSQQRLNTWTEGDISPDKFPSVQNLKTSVAYSDKVIDGAPIVMNASRAIIKLLIDENGTILTPNANQNTVYTTQGNFMSGEYLIVNSLQESLLSGNTNTISSQYKPIIRGGYRPVPILYTQIKDPTNPPLSWATTINFTDDNPLSSATVPDYTATLKPSSIDGVNNSTTPSGVAMGTKVSIGADITTELSTANKYTVSQNVIDNKLDLFFEAKLPVFSIFNKSATVRSSIIRNRGGNVDLYYIYNSPNSQVQGLPAILNIQGVVRNTDLQAGDIFQVGLYTNKSSVFLDPSATFKITTIPLPSPPISASGLFQLTSSLPPGVPGVFSNYIYTTSSLLLQYFNNSAVHQESITSSLFEPVIFPFTLEPGDQFRFESDENKTFEVISYTEVTSSNSSGSLFIELYPQISGSGCDLDRFLLRRYISDAQSIVFGNLTEKEASGVILTPEFTTNLLNNNIDTYIEDLTQKGLL